MSESMIRTRSGVPATEMPRVNVVSAVVFFIPLLLGVLATWLTFNPAGVIAGLVLGALLFQAPKVAFDPDQIQLLVVWSDFRNGSEAATRLGGCEGPPGARSSSAHIEPFALGCVAVEAWGQGRAQWLARRGA